MRFSEIGAPEIGTPQSALLLGEGDGRFLEKFRAAYPNCKITVIEKSKRMIESAQKRLSGAKKSSIRFIHADLLEYDLSDHHYDIMVAHCFFDCFESAEAKLLANRLSSQFRASNGILWIGEFIEPSKIGWPWLRLRGLYLFFRIITGIKTSKVVDIEALFSTPRTQLIRRRFFHRRALASSVYRVQASTAHSIPSTNTQTA